jgi:putative flavoprotein involved in K+ transport
VNEPVECTGTVVIGAGQAGLATSYELMQRGLDHVVLERGRAGEAWRNRWDSLCMILPNWFNCLPGLPYQGPEPDGFQTRDQWIANLDCYVSTFDLPVREGVSVDDVEQRDDGRFAVATSSGTFCADNVVVATGAYQAARLPDIATGIPLAIQQLHSGSYRNPAALPPGAVLVVGTGNSGSQIAEELSGSGREVYLSVGYSGFPLRRYRGKDMYWWFYHAKLHQFRFEGGNVRGISNATGCGGGRALDLREFSQNGIQLLGRIQSIDGAVVKLADDLAESLAAIDRRSEAFRTAVDAYITATGMDAPLDDEPSDELREFIVPASPGRIDLHGAGIASVIWATGYGWDLDWVRFPVLEANGGPIAAGDAGPCPGLYFAGMRVEVPSSTSIGHVGPEAAHIAGLITARQISAR